MPDTNQAAEQQVLVLRCTDPAIDEDDFLTKVISALEHFELPSLIRTRRRAGAYDGRHLLERAENLLEAIDAGRAPGREIRALRAVVRRARKELET